jgi:uncharacterized protein with PIN domain
MNEIKKFKNNGFSFSIDKNLSDEIDTLCDNMRKCQNCGGSFSKLPKMLIGSISTHWTKRIKFSQICFKCQKKIFEILNYEKSQPEGKGI